MNIVKLYKVNLITILLVFLFSGCSNEKYEYYSEKENYVNATGTISFINYDENSSELYLAFDNLSYKFNDNCFKITGENYNIIKNNNIDSDLYCGTIVNFVSAPEYFGDGYVMPIVSLSIGDSCYLEFDEGLNNLLESYQKG